VRALAAGADDYVTKPFGPHELLARLEANWRRIDPEPEQSLIQTGELSVDLAFRAVALGGEEVHLTPTEFDLLRLLARSRGRLVTHRDLLTGVWGSDTATTRRSCAPTSPTSGARSSPTEGRAGTGIYVPILGSAAGLPGRPEPISRGDDHNQPTSRRHPPPVIEHTPPWISPERDPTFEDGPAVTRRGRRMR
jgi:Transcriptional regulatory protein, C terminal